MVLGELGAVALVEDEADAFILQRFFGCGLVVLFPLLVALAGFIQRVA